MTQDPDPIHQHLVAVYGRETADQVRPQLDARLDAFRRSRPRPATSHQEPARRLTAQDIVLITYGDQIQEPGKPPLQSLDETLTALVDNLISGLHILPFFPYSSDDGFSVIDYKAVHPGWGDWADVRRLAGHFRLMVDGVINHISAESAWFQAFRRGEAPYNRYFVTVDPATDLSQVVRPRTLPLLTPVETPDGVRHVWTTFSADQVDLNYAEPLVLLEILDVLLFYVSQGADLIRLDAIGFMWKEPGTSCIHLPQTHHIIQLMRAALDQVAPEVILVTETNVPHAENVSYFGDGHNEAQMVYNFTLPPLTLHAFQSGDASRLAAWAATLTTPSDATTFFNFMASHDGVGLRPLEGILAPDEVAEMAQRVEAHGGLVSYKTNSDGSQSPYELNVVYYDALNDPNAAEPQPVQVDRFMASQAILLSLAGVPGIYAHSLFGSRNWREGVARTGRNRTINRRKFDRAELEATLSNPDSVPYQVFRRYRQLLAARRSHSAFHPNADQRVIQASPAIFSFVRTGAEDRAEDRTVLCLHNVTSLPQVVDFTAEQLRMAPDTRLHDLLDGDPVQIQNGRLTITLPAYGVRWLAAANASQSQAHAL